MLQSTKLGRERILLYGPTGGSKSTSILNIAKWSQRTNSPAQFYIQDTDNTIIDMVELGYPDLKNIHIYPCYDYTDYTQSLDDIYSQINQDDWIATDFVGDIWDACQRHYTEQIFGKGKTDYFMQARREMEEHNQHLQRGDKEQKGIKSYNPRTDWGIINSLHHEYITKLCLRNKCHIISTAKAKTLGDDADQSVKDTYQLLGVMPQGQKYLGHNYRTILLSRKINNRFMINSVKDRERQLLEGVEVRDFTLTYLKGIAGWKI